MCGIAGASGSDDTDRLEEMVARLEHRGPDDDGYYADDGIMLGMRRLSIIDVEGGKQPIHNEDESVWVVFNGEIYNYRELRDELEEAGHTFYTDTDTEVLVHLYEEYGTELVNELNGMFAFALWDAETEQLLLARDRLGIKPLFYTERGGVFYFGSEIKAVLAAGIPRRPDSEALCYYWNLDYIPAPMTAFETVHKLEPGTVLTVADGTVVERRRFWELPGPSGGEEDERYYADRLRALLEDAVERRMQADVPLGAFLSGGIDSSTVVGLMSQLSDEPVHTFSVAFEAEEHDESSFSRFAAEQFGTDHTEYQVRMDDAAVVEQALAHFDEPLADPAVIPTYLIAEKAAQDVKVVNTGSGADELFGGYHRYGRDVTYWNRFRRVPGAVKQLASTASGLFPERTKPWYYLRYLGTMTSQAAAYTYVRTGGGEVLREDGADVRRLMEESFADSADYLQNMTAYDIRYWLPDDLLYKVDRTTMAHSLEARVPFLDHRIVAFSREIPSRYKIRKGTEKHVLRRAVSDLLPERILHREKKGFSVPIAEWMRDPDSPLGQRFAAERFQDIDLLDGQKLMRRYQTFRDGNDRYTKMMWKAAALQLWYEEYVI